MRDAAISSTGNIAEGFGRGHKKDKINFYLFSRGCGFEVQSHLLSGKAAGHFTDLQINPINEKLFRVIEAINKIIKGLS
jgi:four helix bundle protein